MKKFLFVALLPILLGGCSYEEVEDESLAYELRTLTFEDSDARFTSYALDYYGPAIETWSNLIDPLQYGGDLLYNMAGGTYFWYDEGNTE
ncbi:MAG: hypothetical protein IIX59_09300, partial [Alistipes sp.]|nr:hypothetical protein [Alistipes sp.]